MLQSLLLQHSKEELVVKQNALVNINVKTWGDCSETSPNNYLLWIMNSLIVNLLSSTGFANKQNKVKVNDNQTCSGNYPLCLVGFLKLCRNTLLLDSALKTNLWVIWQRLTRLSSFTISDGFLVEFKNSFLDNDFHQRRSNNIV